MASGTVNQSEPVVIVGAGPTGLTAATLLAQRGIRSLVIERYPTPYPLPRAVHIDDEVVRILQQVGIATAFAEVSRPAAGLRLLDAQHRVLAEFRRDLLVGVHGHPQANLFDQPDLERLLRANLARYPQVELLTGTELIALAHSTDGRVAELRVRELGSGTERLIAAAAVLGCDGANSTVRDLIGSRMLPLGFEERWLVLDVQCTVALQVWDGVEQVCDPDRAATFMRIGPERFRWEFRLHPGESVQELTHPQRLPALLAPWIGDPATTPITVRRAVEYTFHARIADSWRSGRVFLLGDAAHLTPPFIGQGLGSGLRDAHNLAWKLAAVLGSGVDERLLDTYQAERKPHARSLIRLARTAGWAMTGGQDRAAAIRRAALRIFCRLPGATTLMLNSTSPSLRPGPLVRRRTGWKGQLPGRPQLAGSLCPQPVVDVVEAGDVVRRQPLDEVLGSGFAVLGHLPSRLAVANVCVRLLGAGEHLPPLPGVIDIRSPELTRWLARHGSAAVLLRPDRVVLTTARAGPQGVRPADMFGNVGDLSGHVQAFAQPGG
jgi:3-(3-hydroxy-phenyl)propionate hydroxylase